MDKLSKKAFFAVVGAGRYDKGLALCLNILRKSPNDSVALTNAAVCCVKLHQFERAMGYAVRAHGIDPENLQALDAISHAAGSLGRTEDVRRYGRSALEARDRRFGIELPDALPMRSGREGARRRIISFSLFGADARYCEPAFLNVLEQPSRYPGWTCRFYIDDTVPDPVRKRLESAGAELVEVDATLKRWPGPMWRFAAYDDPDMERVIFRDADSVISEREAEAVSAWVESGRRFHVMRDGPTHTELILAGLWGVTSGALPSMADQVAKFLKRPLQSDHFADQYFLREFVWPFARKDVLQHDSQFGFGEYEGFPQGLPREDSQVGLCESISVFDARVPAPDGTEVRWQLVRSDDERASISCHYTAIVSGNAIRASIPRRYAKMIDDKAAVIRLSRRANKGGGVTDRR